MKKFLLLFITSLVTQCVYSQPLPVTNPAAESQLMTMVGKTVKQIKEAEKTVKQITKTVKYMEEAKERIEKINGYIKTGETMKEIIEFQTRIAKNCKEKMYLLIESKQFSNSEILSINDEFVKFIFSGIETLKTAKTFVEKGFFKMDDSDRLDKLNALNLKIKDIYYSVNISYSHYDYVAKTREFKKLIGI